MIRGDVPLSLTFQPLEDRARPRSKERRQEREQLLTTRGTTLAADRVVTRLRELISEA